jgi:hypothetical protein
VDGLRLAAGDEGDDGVGGVTAYFRRRRSYRVVVLASA